MKEPTHRSLPVLCAVLLLLSVGSQRAKAQAPQPFAVKGVKIEIELFTDKPAFLSGEYIRVLFIVHNRSDEPLRIMAGRADWYPELGPLVFSGVGEDGNVVTPYPPRGVMGGTGQPPHVADIAAHGSYTFGSELSEKLSLTEPGKYTITAHKRLVIVKQPRGVWKKMLWAVEAPWRLLRAQEFEIDTQASTFVTILPKPPG